MLTLSKFVHGNKPKGCKQHGEICGTFLFACLEKVHYEIDYLKSDLDKAETLFSREIDSIIDMNQEYVELKNVKVNIAKRAYTLKSVLVLLLERHSEFKSSNNPSSQQEFDKLCKKNNITFNLKRMEKTIESAAKKAIDSAQKISSRLEQIEKISGVEKLSKYSEVNKNTVKERKVVPKKKRNTRRPEVSSTWQSLFFLSNFLFTLFLFNISYNSYVDFYS